MATDIEWTDETWNPTTGCTPVSPGCLNCYAATFAHRGLTPAHRGLTVLRDGRAVFNGTIKLHEDRLAIPLGWKKPRRVFVDSMSDLFHEGVPFDFVDRVFAVMALCPQHTFQVLTKRPERMAEYFNAALPLSDRATYVAEMAPNKLNGKPFTWGTPTSRHSRHWPDEYERREWPGWPLPNVWLGASIENQDTADERIPHLLKCPAAVRFLSYEPALGPVDLGPWLWFFHPTTLRNPRPSWVIAGGESGHGSRPANIEWFRSVRDQCKAAGVAFFMKQLGQHIVGELAVLPAYRTFKIDRKGGDLSEWPEDLRVREFPAVTR